jgi:tRNA(Glu) U13 pseudouridine synthase TruD
MKWSFDDFIVEEELPDELFVPDLPSPSPSTTPSSLAGDSTDTPSASPSPSSSPGGERPAQSTSFVVQLLSEGVDDTVVERLLRERLPRSIVFHFLTPVDFVSCASRYVWLRCGDGSADTLPRAFWREQHWHSASGDVYLSPVRRIRLDARAPTFPSHLLPRTRYTVTLRNIQCSLGDILPRLRGIARDGFLNYSHVARHGVGLSRVYDGAKLVLQRDYPAFLRHHLQRLTEGTTQVQRELPVLLEVLASPRSSARDWQGVVEGLQLAVKTDAQIYARTRQSGLYPPHHDLLLDVVRRAADIMPRHHDSAQLIREAVKPLVLQETLHAITDVHFNAHASLRWQQSGDKVVVGDLIRIASPAYPCMADVRGGQDCFVGAADHVNGVMTSCAHQDWASMAVESEVERTMWSVKRIASKEEANHYHISDVVLPTLGKGSDELMSAFPVDAVGTSLFANLARELRVQGLPEMNLAPRAAFRPLVQQPRGVSFYVVDEKRGWDWEEDAGSTALKKNLYHDQDGLLRYRSPLARRTGKNMIARIGIRDEVARRFFLKPARKPGMMCVLQLTLPAGSHVTSALREAFMVATVSPSAIFHLLAK